MRSSHLLGPWIGRIEVHIDLCHPHGHIYLSRKASLSSLRKDSTAVEVGGSNIWAYPNLIYAFRRAVSETWARTILLAIGYGRPARVGINPSL